MEKKLYWSATLGVVLFLTLIFIFEKDILSFVNRVQSGVYVDLSDPYLKEVWVFGKDKRITKKPPRSAKDVAYCFKTEPTLKNLETMKIRLKDGYEVKLDVLISYSFVQDENYLRTSAFMYKMNGEKIMKYYERYINMEFSKEASKYTKVDLRTKDAQNELCESVFKNVNALFMLLGVEIHQIHIAFPREFHLNNNTSRL